MGFYDLKTQRLDGRPADLGEFRGKVTLVVNVASECGFTPQYAGLQKLHDELAGDGFAVLGFPSNEIGGQEPGSAEQIQTFCQRNSESLAKYPRRGIARAILKAGLEDLDGAQTRGRAIERYREAPKPSWNSAARRSG